MKRIKSTSSTSSMSSTHEAEAGSQTEQLLTRRRLLSRVSLALSGVAGGPPPRPLVRYDVRIVERNRVQVRTQPLTFSQA